MEWIKNLKQRFKAFTLVELLAVIAILAIIMLIAIPMILGVIEDAKKDSFRNSIRSVFHAVELKHAMDEVEEGKLTPVSDLDLSGEELTGEWKVENGVITLIKVCNNAYCVENLEDSDKGTEFEVFGIDEIPTPIITKNKENYEIINGTNYDVSSLYTVDYKTESGETVCKVNDEVVDNLGSLEMGTYTINCTAKNSMDKSQDVSIKVKVLSASLIENLVVSINEQNEALNATNSAYNLQTCTKVSDTEYTGDCYFKGANPNNAVWISGRLWRVIGINSDGTIKMITEKPQTAIAYNNTSQTWANSSANTWVNDVFYNGLNSNLQNLIVEQSWDTTAYDDNGVRQAENLSEASKVGLITYAEYLKASSNYIDGTNGTCLTGKETVCGKESDGTITNYLFDNLFSWTLTPRSGSDNTSYLWRSSIGYMGYAHVSYATGVTPVINIESMITVYSGNGNMASPYIIESEKEVTTLAGTDVGSYVNFGGYTWRVVAHETQGTKLIMNDYLCDENGNVITLSFDEDNSQVFIENNVLSDIANYLNNEWTGLSNENKTKLVNATWNLGKYGLGTGYYYDYTTTTTDKTYADVTAKIGLIRAGEQFASQFFNITSGKRKTYWTLTPSSRDTTRVWTLNSAGYPSDTSDSYANNTYGVVPVIVLSSNTSISSGNGRSTNIGGTPYVIE